MHRLVCSGYARPGQTGWALLNSFALDMLLDFVYGMLIDGADQEQREKLDNQLNSMELEAADEAKIISKTLSDGRVVQISEARLARIRANAAGMMQMTRKGG